MGNIDSVWISSGLESIQEDIFWYSVEHTHTQNEEQAIGNDENDDVRQEFHR